MQWAAGLAPGLKLRGLTGKAVVRAAAAARLPRELVGGPKRGFLVPIGEWLRGSHGRRLMEDTALGNAGAPVLDLDYAEDSNADADANFVMTGNGGIVEVQGTAEKKPFSQESFDELMRLARKGIGELVELQKLTVT